MGKGRRRKRRSGMNGAVGEIDAIRIRNASNPEEEKELDDLFSTLSAQSMLFIPVFCTGTVRSAGIQI